MAKNIKGITIEIDGNTTKLNDALSSMNKTINSANSELKTLNNALKLDPKNTELLSQKQELLRKNISASTEKLEQLKEAQRQMGNYNSLTDEQKESYRALSVEISKSESAIKKLNSELNKTGSIDLNKVKDTLSKVGNVAATTIKTVGTVVTTVSAAISAVVAAGVKSYAEFEQLEGGVKTLFGTEAGSVEEYAASVGKSVSEVEGKYNSLLAAQKQVFNDANNAYKTAGISANEYMSTVTSFSASLISSLNGDTEAAAKVSNQAIIDMADNANKFGTDMLLIQNAYQGFAKQNYAMLDNLKLGYGGTKTEMERLLKDAEKFSGVKYDINNLSDVYNAIHVIQEEMGVAGTTALEASTTISGSMNSMKAAFDNFLNGSGSPEQLSNAIITFINNVVVVIEQLAPSILTGITTLIKTVLPKIITLIVQMLPTLLSAVQDLISSLLNLIQENVQPLADTVVSLFMSLVTFILDNLPMLIETALQIVIALATGIADNIDELIPSIINAVLLICDVLIENTDKVIEAALILTLGIAKGLIKAIPSIIKKIPELISKMVSAYNNYISKFVDIGKNLVSGIWDGIKGSYEWIKNKIKGWIGDITKFIKKLFGINSPSKVMKEQVGQNLGLGIAEGIDSTVKDVEQAMKGLSSKVEASVNPVINPTANTNPLIIQIENFNNTRQTDIQALSEELEFYRKNSSLAKGGN